MNWDAIGAIGEIVGASAVVVSLIYLAIQIKNQNAESRAATAFSKFFEMRRHHFRPEFAAYVDELEYGDYSYIKSNERAQSLT